MKEEAFRSKSDSVITASATSLASYVVLMAIVGLTTNVKAEDLNDTTIVRLAQASEPAAVAVAPPTTSQVAPLDYTRFNPYRIRGANIPLPGPADTIEGNAFGLRDALASLGIGWFGYSTSFFADNILRHGLPLNNQRGNQVYNGQLPTYFTSNIFDVTYDISRYGIPDGQLVAGVTYTTTSWNPAGPRTTGLSGLTYYQTLFNKKVEFNAGYEVNSLQYLDTFVGGSLAGGIFGPNGTIPVEAGIDNAVVSTLGANAKIYLPSNFYTKFGIQRALSPDGTIVEHNQNASEVRFKVPNAGALFIDETGYQVNAASGRLSTWVRVAVNYTSSNYREISSTFGQQQRVRGEGEYGAYALADQQILQTNSHPGAAAGQGLYVGGSIFYAPSGFNVFSRNYEARIYGFGLIPGRPSDLASAVFDDTVFSSYLVEAARRAGSLAHSDAKSYTASYSAHVLAGIYLNAGLAYVDHPSPVTYNGSTGSALNTLLGSSLFF